MSELKDFFEERKNEVNIYFNFINHVGIDHNKHKTIKFDSKNQLQTTDNLKQVLKSNCILILYNLIEGLVSKSIECIIDDINDNKINYKELKNGLKKIMLKSNSPSIKNNFKDLNINLVHYLDSLDKQVFNLELTKDNKKIILSGGGNIDSKYIRDKIASNLHINFKRQEDSLRIIKTDRNHLAHGSKSYIECSQNKTLNDIKKQKTKIFKYLGHYVDSIDKFIINKKYKV